jgi:hypothetical protein
MVVLLAGIQSPTSFVIDLEAGSENPVGTALTNVTVLIHAAQDPAIDQKLRLPMIAPNRSDPLVINRPPKNNASSYRPKNIVDSRNLCALLMNQL